MEGSSGAAVGGSGPGREEAAADGGLAAEAAGSVPPQIHARPGRVPEELKVAARALLEEAFAAAEAVENDKGSDAGEFTRFLRPPLWICGSRVEVGHVFVFVFALALRIIHARPLSQGS